MLLDTDEQTLTDLGIFGKGDAGGIYDVYNHTHTRGGEAVLAQLFRNPLADREAINRRSEMIAYFARLKVLFPFDATVLDMTEKYLAQADDRQKQASSQGALSEKEIHSGVVAVIALLQHLRTFIEREELRAMEVYAPEREGMAGLLAGAALQPALQEKTKGRLSYTAVTAYDVLFRFRERQKIEQLLAFVYQLDVYLSVARVAMERKFVFPHRGEHGGEVHLFAIGQHGLVCGAHGFSRGGPVHGVFRDGRHVHDH